MKIEADKIIVDIYHSLYHEYVEDFDGNIVKFAYCNNLPLEQAKHVICSGRFVCQGDVHRN
jgi:hypothetical protein